jgi:lipoprotein-anchoring transpeptidase ErfK/SrfK
MMIARGRSWGALAGALAVVLTACGSGRSGGGPPPTTVVQSPAAANNAPVIVTPRTPTPSQPPPPRRGSGNPVHVSLYESDGQTFGVGMPIIAYFSAAITDASVFDQVTEVTVDGEPVHGAWYFERSSQADQALEAHYRLPAYWPAHASINMSLPLAGLWAGKGLVFDDNLTLSMRTGAAQLVKIDGKSKRMHVYSDGKLIRTFPVSLGKATTPTYAGTAVVIGKANPQDMVSAPGEPYYNIEVPWSVRVTYDGEFIHDAYWNGELGQANLSHGCTNLSPANAKWYYHYSVIGDPVTWTNTGTSASVPVWDGYGDWNLSWASYSHGGLL